MRIADPMEQDEQMVLDREDEAIREQRWTDFSDWVKSARSSILLRSIADLMDGQRDPYHIPSCVQAPILNFQETEGWSGVLSCVARVVKEIEK